MPRNASRARPLSAGEKMGLRVRRSAAVLLLIAALCAAVLYVGGLWPFDRPVGNVVIISIDTTRADYLGCMGRAGGITPHIDALAADGVLFENAISPVPETLPSHSTMLTGTDPVFHGVHRNENYSLGESNETLAERLRDEGFCTAAIVSSFVLDRQFGLDQGFDSYSDRFEGAGSSIGINERRGEEVSREAVSWLAAQGDRPFFLFLHYFDPHMTYDPPEPFKSRFAGESYAGEIAYVDHCIGQVVAALKEQDLYDSTLIVVTSDHGEMLGEHGELTHSYYIYQSAVRVPLIFKAPRHTRHKEGVRRSGLVGLVDIVPTVCVLLGIDPPAEVQGVDLSPTFSSAAEPDTARYIYCESTTPTAFRANPLLGLVTHDGWKYILTTRPELYNLSADPAEETNLVGREQRRATLLREHLEQIVADQNRAREEREEREDYEDRAGRDAESRLDSSARKRLESLGYVSGAARLDLDIDPDRDDPKDLIGYHRKASQVLAFVGTRQYDRAEALCKELVADRPDLHAAWQMLGNFAMLKRDFAAAVSHSEEVLRIAADDPLALYRLGYAHNRLGHRTEAKETWSRLIETEPRHALGLRDLGLLLQSEGDYDGAMSILSRAVESDPDDFMALRGLAWIVATHPDVAARDGAEAIRLAQKAIGLVPRPGAPLLDTLAAAQAAAGLFDQAIASAESALRLVDESSDAPRAEAIKKRLALYRRREAFVFDLSLPGGE